MITYINDNIEVWLAADYNETELIQDDDIIALIGGV